MRGRDWDYIETRLLAPCVPASEAFERMLEVGLGDEAEELMEAMKSFVDAARKVRNRIAEGMRP